MSLTLLHNSCPHIVYLKCGLKIVFPNLGSRKDGGFASKFGAVNTVIKPVFGKTLLWAHWGILPI